MSTRSAGEAALAPDGVDDGADDGEFGHVAGLVLIDERMPHSFVLRGIFAGDGGVGGDVAAVLDAGEAAAFEAVFGFGACRLGAVDAGLFGAGTFFGLHDGVPF